MRDTNSRLARFAMGMLRHEITHAKRYFLEMDPRFATAVDGAISAHLALESRGEHVVLDEYVQPTADAFGYVFSLLARISGMNTSGAQLSVLGRHIASAVIAFDCYVDWRCDRQKGSFNPLRNEREIWAATEYADMNLHEAARVARGIFGADSLTGRTLEEVRERVARRVKADIALSTWRFGRLISDALSLLLAPPTSLIDSSQWSERRDKFGVCCAILTGACVQCVFEGGSHKRFR